MKKLITATSSMAIALGLISCTTTYDAAGRPVQSVDPGVAVAGAVGAGIIGAAIANNNNDNRRRYYNRRTGRYFYR